jgi:DeoR/GlpR family transcriptional regulator of sugar metabolism
MKRALAARAAETYVLGSDEKFGTASRYTVVALDAVAGIVADVPEDDPTSQALTAGGVPLVRAG